MKSLKAIPVLAKIGKIISKVLFILCIVGFCGCVLGIVGLAAGLSVMKIGGVTLHGLIEIKAGMSLGTMYAILAAAAI